MENDPNKTVESRRSNDMESTEQAPVVFSVSGRITDAQTGEGIANLIVRAFDRDLRGEELLGEALTSPNGSYSITYAAEQFMTAEKNSADLIVRVFSRTDERLAESEIVYNAPTQVIVNLTVALNQVLLSEFERLSAEIAPLLRDVSIAA
jgi:hypothetical protein